MAEPAGKKPEPTPNEAAARTPDDAQAQARLVMSLADAGKSDEALALSRRLRRAYPDNADVQLSIAEACEKLGQFVEALTAYDRVLTLQPDNARALNGRWHVVSQLGGSELALEKATQQQGVDPGVIQTLHEDAAAEAVRWGERIYVFHPAERYRWTNRALTLLEDNIKRYPQSLRSRFDYVRALEDRHYSRRAIREYEALLKKKAPIPGYTHLAGGQAYLDERRPEQAKRAFENALQRDPADFQARIGLLIAYSDMNQYDQARRISDTLSEGLRDPNKQFEADMLVAWERAYENRFDVALSLFDKLRGGAPYSTGPLNALGTMYRWRGWPRRARQQYELAARRDANSLDAQIGLAKADMDIGHFASADERIKHLESVYADEPEVKKLARRWHVHDMSELNTDVAWSGDGNKAKGRSLRVDTTFFSRPLAYQFRPFVHEYYEQGQFDDAKGYYKRAGAGVEYAIPSGGRALAEIAQDIQDDRTGGTARLDLWLGDYWSIGVGAQSESLSVPLRARADGITGKSGEARIALRGSERWEAEVNAQRLLMTDGNQRNYGGLRGELGVVTRPSYKARFVADVEHSTNTLTDTAYFNPNRDTSYTLTLRNDWLMFKRYDRSFHQRLYLTAGVYDQNGYGRHWQDKLRYEHAWRFSDTARLTYSVGYGREVYDGTAVNVPEFLLTGAWRF